MEWEPKDVVAVLAVAGCIFLMALGYNHMITNIFAAVIAVYVGVDFTLKRRSSNGKTVHRKERDRDGPD